MQAEDKPGVTYTTDEHGNQQPIACDAPTQLYIKMLLDNGWQYESVAHAFNAPIEYIQHIERKYGDEGETKVEQELREARDAQQAQG